MSPAEPGVSRRALLGLGALRMLPDQLLEPPRPAPAPPSIDVEALKERAREVWSAGDYRELGSVLEPAALEAAEAGAAGRGRRVLDVGAGDGNFALAAARRGALVTACDLSPVLVEQGRRRSKDDGQEIEWLVADAEALPLADESFDLTGSCFGAMYAPRPSRATAELFRVTRPGGIVVMANWASSGFMGRLLASTARHLEHHPRAVPRPAQWGRYETVYREFLAHTHDFDVRGHVLPLAAASRDAMCEALLRHPGDLSAGQARLGPDRLRSLREELLDLVEAYAREAAGGRCRVDVDYDLVVARKPGSVEPDARRELSQVLHSSETSG